jgi:hypothetical protein
LFDGVVVFGVFCLAYHVFHATLRFTAFDLASIIPYS